MIVYKNRQRKLRNKEEEIEAVRRLTGQPKRDGEIFELIECVLNRPSVSPVKKHGWQDTEIHVAQDGKIDIQDYPAGMGILRFEPSRFGNPVAYCDMTPHNRAMFIRHYREKEYSITNRHFAEEIKKAYEIWWKDLPKEDKEIILEREERKKRDQFSMPSERGAPDTDSAGKSLMGEIAELREKNRALEEANRQLQDLSKDKYGLSGEEEKEPAPETKEPDYPTIKDPSSGETYDFKNMLPFDVQKVARNKGIVFNKTAKKAELVRMIVEKIEKEKPEKEAVT